MTTLDTNICVSVPVSLARMSFHWLWTETTNLRELTVTNSDPILLFPKLEIWGYQTKLPLFRSVEKCGYRSQVSRTARNTDRIATALWTNRKRAASGRPKTRCFITLYMTFIEKSKTTKIQHFLI